MSRTTPLVTIMLLLLLLGCDTGTTHRNAEEEIIAAERSALDKWSTGDALGYISHAAEDISYFDDIGAKLRIDGLDSVRSYFASLEGNVPAHSYEIVDPRVQVYGDVGLLTLHYHGATLEGKPLTKWKATLAYRHSAGSWRLVHANWSIIKEEKPEN